MRAAGRNAERPGDDVPRYGARERAEHDARVDDIGGDDAGAHGFRDMRSEDQEGESRYRRPFPAHRAA
jgi:hypothetical protein